MLSSFTNVTLESRESADEKVILGVDIDSSFFKLPLEESVSEFSHNVLYIVFCKLLWSLNKNCQIQLEVDLETISNGFLPV